MSQKLRAKFNCQSVSKNGNTEEVHLSAVYGNDDRDNEENNQFSEATPWGDLKMGVDNPAAQGFFEEGKNYYLDFTPSED